jgi:hypothetical protein
LGRAEPDKYKCAADEPSGVYSPGRRSGELLHDGRAVRIGGLVRILTAPIAAPLPDRSSKIPMPVRI